MKQDFALPQSIDKLPEITVRALWKVSADSSYDVFTGLQKTGGDVFIRTTGGQGTVVLGNGSSMNLRENSLIRLRASQIHHYFCSGENWDFRWYNCEVIGPLNIPRDTVLPLEWDDYEEINSERALELLKSPFESANRIGSADCLGLILHWTRLIEKLPGYRSGTSPRLQIALDHISSHFDSPLSMDELAALSSCSVRRFRDIFREETGMTPVAYIRQRRLKGAVQRLLHTNLSLREIAVTTGFNTEQYFCRVFKGEYGLSPYQYKKSALSAATNRSSGTPGG